MTIAKRLIYLLMVPLVALLGLGVFTRLQLRTTKGHCRGSRPARCAIGALRPGQRATITVDVVARRLGRTRNLVGVTSSTSDPDLRNNRAGALVTVLRPLPPRFTG